MKDFIFNLIKKYRELITYSFFGVITAFISMSTFWILCRIFGDELYLINNAVSWFLAITFAFFTNKLIVFRSKSFSSSVFIKEILMFYSSRILSFTVEEIGLWILVDFLGFGAFTKEILFIEITGELVSKMIVGVISIIMNFLASKFITFKNKNT